MKYPADRVEKDDLQEITATIWPTSPEKCDILLQLKSHTDTATAGGS